MNTKLLWILIVIVIVALGAWFAYGRQTSPTPDMAITTPDATVTGSSEAETVTVTYTDEGFTPSPMIINVGDTVRFVNNSSGDMWVGADEHPTHTSYDGTATREHCADGVNTNGSFDQCVRSAPNTSWSYTFTKTGSFDYHNHARAAHSGTVEVR